MHTILQNQPAHHFNQEGVLSSTCMEKIILILRKDQEIEYYADLFFADSI
jgi:hypothetical protein